VSYAETHWSESQLACAYNRNCLNEELAGVGQWYIPEVDNYLELPLWVSWETDEADFLANIGTWNQFVFGWDDFLHPRVFLGAEYEPGSISQLSDPRVSAHRETYRQMLAGK